MLKNNEVFLEDELFDCECDEELKKPPKKHSKLTFLTGFE